ncbi:armadillo repeat-containing protein 5 [Microdochium nivale]|nr:armadillo repeat-containing protein 5 [Microdochium nivale]
MTSAAAPSVTEDIDARGDLILVIGEAYATETPAFSCRVCSRALARASPVFATMLYGGFAESKPSERTSSSSDWIVHLPEDDAVAMQQLLHLLHGNHDRFTTTPSFTCHANIEAVYDILVAADKYDCETYLLLWAIRWDLDVQGIMTYKPHTLMMLAWIYYKLGDKGRYEWVVKTLIWDHECPSVMKDRLLAVLPPNLLASIDVARQILIHNMIACLPKQVDHYNPSWFLNQERSQEKPHAWLGWRPKSGAVSAAEATVCSQRQRRSIIGFLAERELWPVPPAKNVTRSVARMRKVICGLQTFKVHHSELGKSFLLPYGREGPKFTEYKYHANQEDVDYMAKQAEKTRLNLV